MVSLTQGLVACLVKRTSLVLHGSTQSSFYGGFSQEKTCWFHRDCCPDWIHQMMLMARVFGKWFWSICCTVLVPPKMMCMEGFEAAAANCKQLNVRLHRLDIWIGTSRNTVSSLVSSIFSLKHPDTAWYHFGKIDLAMMGIQVICKDPQHGLFMMVEPHTSWETNKLL